MDKEWIQIFKSIWCSSCHFSCLRLVKIIDAWMTLVHFTLLDHYRDQFSSKPEDGTKNVVFWQYFVFYFTYLVKSSRKISFRFNHKRSIFIQEWIVLDTLQSEWKIFEWLKNIWKRFRTSPGRFDDFFAAQLFVGTFSHIIGEFLIEIFDRKQFLLIRKHVVDGDA